MFQEKQETEEYYVTVRKDSSYNAVEDISGEDIYSFQLEDDVKADVDNKVDVTFETGDNLTDLGKNLLDKSIDVILVSSSQYSILSEEIKEFKDNTKMYQTVRPGYCSRAFPKRNAARCRSSDFRT